MPGACKGLCPCRGWGDGKIYCSAPTGSSEASPDSFPSCQTTCTDCWQHNHRQSPATASAQSRMLVQAAKENSSSQPPAWYTGPSHPQDWCILHCCCRNVHTTAHYSILLLHGVVMRCLSADNQHEIDSSATGRLTSSAAVEPSDTLSAWTNMKRFNTASRVVAAL